MSGHVFARSALAMSIAMVLTAGDLGRYSPLQIAFGPYLGLFLGLVEALFFGSAAGVATVRWESRSKPSRAEIRRRIDLTLVRRTSDAT